MAVISLCDLGCEKCKSDSAPDTAVGHHHYSCSGDGIHLDRECHCSNQPSVTHPCCPRLRSPDQETYPVQEKDVRLADVTVALAPTIENPFPVYSQDGRFLGSAVVTLGSDTFYVRFILDPHTPEAFDLTNESDRCRVNLKVTLAEGVFKGSVILTSK